MKRITITLSILALSALFVTCKKEKNVAPVPDTETESAVQASWALYAVTDLEQMCAFMGENQTEDHFYKRDPGVPTSNTVVATRDTGSKTLNMSFNNSSCADGRVRSGSVFMDYGGLDQDYVKAYYTKYGIPTTNNPRFYHEFGFLGRLTFSQYKVDGWTIMTDSANGNTNDHPPAVVFNNMGKSNFDPKTETLKFRIIGSFVLYHPTDRSKDMTLNCDLVKTVVNSTSAKVFTGTPVAKNSPVTWSLAVVAYSGKITGYTANKAPYTMEISESTPLTRDFTCFPDKVGSVSIGTGTQALVPHYQEHHPFISGIASFTTSLNGVEQYPRKIYYGNEGNVDLPSQCDNTGEVLIKGISYRVDFWK